ncbi:MAG: M4 family metallopeptidase [Bacteroidetes bacterium]|nr:M4 family metallopeptidase [Bacteroidota bacterium]
MIDGSNTVVFTTQYINNTNPPVAFNNLNISMGNPPYKIEVWDYDAIGGDDYGGSYSITTSVGTKSWSGGGNNGSYIIDTLKNPALDVHWGIEKTFDFYKNQLNRNSYDNAGSIIKSYVHYDVKLSNAFWNGSVMSYGDGDGGLTSPLVSLDVVGHEFTHAVVEYTADLAYQGESGALNESFADIFGTAIEFYSAGSPNWTIGENVFLKPPFYMRSMSNPNIASFLLNMMQPDTYNGTFWASTTSPSDDGGVHTNSGVQNYWFYLLSQGGSGTNDISNVFSVTGIGINQATQIAYRNLAYYLTKNSNYSSSFNGSLQAAQDLYGVNSTQVAAVRSAWYAVGIGNSPSDQCIGTVNLSDVSGTLSDGSGTGNYQNNLNCSWLIKPKGADSIALTFSAFKTEAGYDTVFVYNGPTTASPLLMTWWGNTIPPVIKGNKGAMLVRFSSDVSNTDSGWKASYVSYGTTYCDGGNLLTTASGSFSDGSGANNYGNNSLCYWLIAPPCANSVTLSFSSFNTELNYDGILVYNGNNTNAPLILNTSGSSIPSNVTATSGEMLVVFVSDYIIKLPGFSANYTSTGSAYCSGTTTLNTSDYGTISDGSGNNNYCNNTDCRWLIQPPQASSVTLRFTSFNIEAASSDGKSIYDAVEVYDGVNTSAPLLGRYSGNTLPPSLTSTGGSMYIKFYSNVAVSDSGWSAVYTSVTNNACSGITTLTADSGTFSDGSGGLDYGNNADCKWLIQPAGASSISLNFTSFDTESNLDGVVVYDGADTNAAKLGVFTGNTIPPTVNSSSGSMLVWFLSDQALRRSGWNAKYNSTSVCGSISKPIPKAGFTINSASQCLPGNNFIFTDTTTLSVGTMTREWKFSYATNGSISPISKTFPSVNTYTAKLIVTTNNGCKDSITKTVTVNPQPSVPSINAYGPTTFCEGKQVTLSTNFTGVNYQWVKDNNNITLANSPTYMLI